MYLNELFDICIKQHASDLHLCVGMHPILRIDGELIAIKNSPVFDAKAIKNLIYSLMNKSQQQLFEKDLELDFLAQSEAARFRVNAYHDMNGIAVAFRLIPKRVPTLDELNMPPVFKSLLDFSNGLIIVTGSTGSGKSTTLAAMIDYINTHQACHIITIEDPIEFAHSSRKSLINQRQVGRDTHDFNQALRSALREDPDVILVGEMRDLETIRLALTAAETGHLVIGTLHTSSAPRSVSRIVDVFPSGEKNSIRNMLSESLQAVVCQTLIKKATQGRIPAFEIMLASPAIRNLIREDKIAQMYSIMQTNDEKGMCILDQYLQKLVTNQDIDKQVARIAAVNKETFI